MPRVIVLREHNAVSVLTDTKGLRTLVIDRDVADANPQIMLGGEEAAIDSILEGIPKVQPERVAAIYAQIEMHQNPVPPVKEPDSCIKVPRVVIFTKKGTPLLILVNSLNIEVQSVHRDYKFGDKTVEVEGSSAKVHALRGIAVERIDELFLELSRQMEDILAADALTQKDRVQLMYIARHWCATTSALV